MRYSPQTGGSSRRSAAPEALGDAPRAPHVDAERSRAQVEQLTADLTSLRTQADAAAREAAAQLAAQISQASQTTAGLQADLATARAELHAADRARQAAEEHAAARISDLQTQIQTLRDTQN